MSRRTRLFLLTALAAGGGLGTPRPAAAIATDAATAEALFRQGRRLFDERRYAEACPKLAQSYEKDPATGCLLALAACHEEEGKSATAWSEYRDAIERAEHEGRADRAEVARRQAAALEGRLSRLSVTLSSGAARIRGLVIRRDGVILDADALGTPMVVDPGPHAIEASAPGYEPWSERFVVPSDAAAGEGQGSASSVVAVVVPALAEAPTWASTDGISPLFGKTPLQTVGLATGVVALVAFAASGFLTIRAVGKNNDSQSDCANDACGPAGKQARLDAIAAANGASVAFAVGAVLAAGGVTLFFLGEPGAGKRIAASPSGVWLEGGF